jgi:hypothetical protein
MPVVIYTRASRPKTLIPTITMRIGSSGRRLRSRPSRLPQPLPRSSAQSRRRCERASIRYSVVWSPGLATAPTGQYLQVSYTNFFLGSVTVAGALTGLLFVALSVSPQRQSESGLSVEHQSVAATAFTALVDSLWISLVALLPGNGIPKASLILGLFGLTSTVGLTISLWRARSQQKFSHRWPVLLPFIVLLYGFQAAIAFTATSSEEARRAGATFVMIFFGVGIARSWELLGLRGGGLLDLLVTRTDRAGHAEPVGTARDASTSTVAAAGDDESS